jgi:HopA1 effector protein family
MIPFCRLDSQYLETLHDIVEQVTLQSDFSIRHFAHPPLELSPQIVDRIQQLPESFQHQYFSLQVQNFLHDLYFKGDSPLVPDLPGQPEMSHPTRQQEQEFYAQLHAHNHGTGYFDPGWLVLRQESDDRLAVRKQWHAVPQGLTLHIERDRHLSAADRSATVGDLVAIHLPQNLVESDRYIAVSNAGLVAPDFPAIDLYFNCSSTGAIALMADFTQLLNVREMLFSFSVLSHPADYSRYDAAILQIERDRFSTIHPLLQTLYPRYRSQFQAQTPLFTKPLAPGLAVAEVPDSDAPDFGSDRCQIIANLLLEAWALEAWEIGTDSIATRLKTMHHDFSELGISLHSPYLNPGSEDIYVPLN